MITGHFRRHLPRANTFAEVRNGEAKVHGNTQLPLRHKEDIAKLSDEERAVYKVKNKAISSRRMKIEHIIGRIKRFKMVAERYRNRLKR
jgi:hypothetical protein